MSRIPFKVSAKTARLFGRENVSNAEGAIAELIKNTYDADATVCLICFLPRFLQAPSKLSSIEHRWLRAANVFISKLYENVDGVYQLSPNLSAEQSASLDQWVREWVDLWIVDNGSGMSAKTIEENWMVIGTNYKEEFAYSDQGRVRTGAKGIGRFALDRLGSLCSLNSTSKKGGSQLGSISWNIDWSEFDQVGKVLEDISAELLERSQPASEMRDFLAQFPAVAAATEEFIFGKINEQTGTAIRIGLLRDAWSAKELQHLEKSLGALIPPAEQRALSLFLFDSRQPQQHGDVDPQTLADFDYRVDAKILETGDVEFNIQRNELEYSNIDLALFESEEMQEPPFDSKSFEKSELSYKKNLSELFLGSSPELLQEMAEIGPFDVNLLFFKRSTPSKDDQKRYPYRMFQPGPRKSWLDEFGGIKIYRDNFEVRPYGTLDGRSFDWLTLGQRVAVSPVAASRKGWKVSPQNIAGTVSISRQTNSKLEDQSNREGIIENKSFAVFKSIILRIIQVFEDDRSHIFYNLKRVYDQQNKSDKIKSIGEATASRVKNSPDKATKEDVQALVQAVEVQQKEIEELERDLRDEQIMLRSLATLGTVLISFSHEMGQLQNTMGSRSAELSDILTSYVSQDDLIGVGGAFNPFNILKDWEEDDKKVKQWFKFALASVRSDKRRRKWIAFREHLKKTKKNWSGFLSPREVELNIEFEDEFDPNVMAFEMDLDSIFNNLILNSVEAFLSPNHKGKRNINITVSSADPGYALIEYWDNGPGISKSIKDPKSIFNFSVTTKVDEVGRATGTGLGLWILAAVVGNYQGTAKAFFPNETKGFRMEIQLPIKQEAQTNG